jgi:hypothetical protein
MDGPKKNCFRYLKRMSPLNAAICTTTYLERQKCYGPDKKILFKLEAQVSLYRSPDINKSS